MPSTPAHSVPKPHGTLIITDGNGVTTHADTLRCCHCQRVWVVMRGSGIRRGFCTKCAAVTCGAPECDPCAPWEKQLEGLERRAR